MANLTLNLADDVIRRARLRAVEQGTSVNAVVAAYLERFAGPNPATAALEAFLDLAATSVSGSGKAGRTWTRDELHDRSNLR